MNKIEQNIQLIKDNPNLSGNKIYQLSKSKGIGIRKQDFYKLYRTEKLLPEPTIEKQEKSVPIKYRIQKGIKFPTKKGQYGIIEIIDINKNTYWIKYTSKKDFKKQLDNLSSEYPLTEFQMIFHGFRKYTSFIEQEFKKYMLESGVSL